MPVVESVRALGGWEHPPTNSVSRLLAQVITGHTLLCFRNFMKSRLKASSFLHVLSESLFLYLSHHMVRWPPCQVFEDSKHSQQLPHHILSKDNKNCVCVWVLKKMTKLTTRYQFMNVCDNCVFLCGSCDGLIVWLPARFYSMVHVTWRMTGPANPTRTLRFRTTTLPRVAKVCRCPRAKWNSFASLIALTRASYICDQPSSNKSFYANHSWGAVRFWDFFRGFNYLSTF